MFWCPQICLSAAMTLVALPVMVKGTLGWLLPRQAVQWIARLAPRLACGAILVLSLSRVAALLLNYGAPLQVYRQLPEVASRHLASADIYVVPPMGHQPVVALGSFAIPTTSNAAPSAGHTIASADGCSDIDKSRCRGDDTVLWTT